MAKVITRIILGLCLICSHLNSISQDAVLSRQRSDVVRTYTAQIGVREKTGHNDGTQVEGYLRTVGLGKGYAWCAAFTKWCYLQAGVKEANAITGAAASNYRKGYTSFFAHRWTSQPRPGDVFCLYFPSLKRIGHTGFYAGWANKSAGTIITVEGNTNGGGSRDGDGVYRRIRQAGTVYSISRWIND